MKKNKKKKEQIGALKSTIGVSQSELIWRRYKKNKLAMIGLAIMIIYMLLILTAPLYIDYAGVTTMNIAKRFMGPGREHIFGTDQYGRDLFARIVYGGRISLFAGLASVALSLLISCALGGLAGYKGGRIDNVIMRVLDIFMAVPSLLLSMAIVAALGTGISKLLIAITITSIPGGARMVRSATLSVKNQEFIEAARSGGQNSVKIIIKHILPNCIGPIIINATLSLGTVIMSIASLGFLGIGITPPTPEWGTILSENRQFIRNYVYLGIIPGAAIGLAVMSLNFIGDGLRDAFDPRTRK
ncbi:ABC transporter permease [Clostridium sp. chh4-2]|uniref:ABC transporter permease n=1 Tax=Clostridium sp. chh4-2 TaxID=2067550 RepID=UPI001FA834B5|nr:ABC transporter permease [Clostridium sp. chh4-2]